MRTPCKMYGKCVVISSLSKNFWWKERDQLDSGGGGALSQGGGALSQGAGYDGNFFRGATALLVAVATPAMTRRSAS